MASPATTVDAPLPSPPFIDVPGLPNFRDAGGYPLASDPRKIVRRGILFRASEPSLVTDAGVALMSNQLGIRKVYDLRSHKEIVKDTQQGGRQVKEWSGAERVFAPVFAEEDYSPEAIAKRFSAFASEGSEGFVQVYTRILAAGSSPDGAQPFATILRHLSSSSSPPSPVLIHCTAGKDRTGVIVALILSLCGVPDDAVAHEYSLTDLGLKARKEEFVSNLIQAPPLEGNRPAAERMVSSRRENMRGTLRLVRERWGDAEGFVKKECGLAAAEVEAIRRNLVVDVDGGEQKAVEWEKHARLTL